jgi:hypothetical protein
LDLNGIRNPVLINQITILNEPLLLHCSIFIKMQKSDNDKEEITIIESNKVFLKENEIKDRHKKNSFSVFNKSNQLDGYIEIAEKMLKDEN